MRVDARPRDPRVVLARHETAARAGREVDDQVGILVADALDHLAIMRKLHARPPVRMADMDMGDGGADLGRLQRRIGDLLRRARQRGILLHRGEIAGHRDREDRLLGFAGHVRFVPYLRCRLTLNKRLFTLRFSQIVQLESSVAPILRTTSEQAEGGETPRTQAGGSRGWAVGARAHPRPSPSACSPSTAWKASACARSQPRRTSISPRSPITSAPRTACWRRCSRNARRRSRRSGCACWRSATSSGKTPTLEQILDAFLRPALTLGVQPQFGGPAFVKLRARLGTEPEKTSRKILAKAFDQSSRQFIDAIAQVLPGSRARRSSGAITSCSAPCSTPWPTAGASSR